MSERLSMDGHLLRASNNCIIDSCGLEGFQIIWDATYKQLLLDLSVKTQML